MDILLIVVVLSAMIVAHELGHFLVAKRAGVKVEEFGLGYPPRLFALRRGETDYSINAIPFGGFVKILGEEDPTQPRSFARAPKRWRLAVLLAGAAMNMVLAVLFFTAAFAIGFPGSYGGVEVVRIAEESPAEKAGLVVGDVIIRLAGQPVATAEDLIRVTQAHLGQEIEVRVRRGESHLALTTTPRQNWPEGQGPMGVVIADRPPYPLPKSLGLGLRTTGEVALLPFYIPILVIQGVIPVEMARPVGPVGMFQITSQAAQHTITTGWWFPLLSMAGLLNAALGITQLLPLPALDGGRLLFVFLEALRGRRVSPEKEGLVHTIGMAVLLSMMVLVTYLDLLSPITLDWGAP